jgi:hypothetical protein
MQLKVVFFNNFVRIYGIYELVIKDKRLIKM